MRPPFRAALFPLGLLLAAGCSSTDADSAPLASSALLSTPGAVAVASNDASANSILVFARRADGSLEGPTSYSTGGAGSGAGLGNQGGVIVSGDGHYLLAVNAGSNDISVFAISGTGLTLTDRVSSGGTTPISLTEHNGVVYVLNAGGNGGITGFSLGNTGSLTALAGSSQALSTNAAGPAEVAFAPDGSHLVVTEKATNQISVYPVNGAGVAGAANSQASVGMTPFGFAFDASGHLIVSEAFGGAAGASAVSSYFVRGSGMLRTRSASVATTQTAACWIAITPNGRYAYTTNTGSASVSGYSINGDGALSLLSGATGHTGAGPIDAAVTPDGRRLYTLDSGSHQLSNFAIHQDGSLEGRPATTGLPASTNGLAAW